jgi:hypothetical protein
MAKDAARKVWHKPELNRLGEIRDVAGNSGVGTQQGNNKS